MRLSEIQVGNRYTCKVSGAIVVVRVTAINEVHSCGKWCHRIEAKSEVSGRSITIKSPQRLRSCVDDEHLRLCEKGMRYASVESWSDAREWWQKSLAVAPEKYQRRYQGYIDYATKKIEMAAATIDMMIAARDHSQISGCEGQVRS